MNFLKINIPALVWTLVIFILCSMPGKAIPEFSWMELLSLDKLIHGFIFFVLQLLYMHGFKTQEKNSFIRRFYLEIPLIGCIIYGAVLELMQFHIFSSRSGDYGDFIANSTGVITASILYKFIENKIDFFYRKLGI
ncbi:MAG: VanZ family protein [Bacteroidota bacterium]